MCPQTAYIEGKPWPLHTTVPLNLYKEYLKATKYCLKGKKHMGKFVSEAICAKLADETLGVEAFKKMNKRNGEEYPVEEIPL